MTINLENIADTQRREIRSEIFHQAITPSLDRRIRNVKSLLEADFRKKDFSDAAVKALEALTVAFEKQLGINLGS